MFNSQLNYFAITILPCILCVPSVFSTLGQYQFLAQSLIPTLNTPTAATPDASRSAYTSPYPKLPPPTQAFPEYQSPYQNQIRESRPPECNTIDSNINPPAVAAPASSPPQPNAYQPERGQLQCEQSVVDRIFNMANPTGPGGAPLDVDNLNTVINRVGHELRFLSEKSRECLYDKVKGLAQLKRMREGLKNTYNDVYNIQYALAAYQEQLKEMKEYLKKNRGRIVVVDNKQLGEMYSMVRRLQAAAENMVSGSVRTQCSPST